MVSPKIVDSVDSIHVVEPHQAGSKAVRTLCGYDVTDPTYDEECRFVNCIRCGVAVAYAEEAAHPLNKAISFGRQEALFDTRIARYGGSPTPWAKLSLDVIEDMWERAGEIFKRAVADDLPAESVIRAAYRFESLRLEIAYQDAQRARRKTPLLGFPR